MDDKSKIRKIIKTTLNEFLSEQNNIRIGNNVFRINKHITTDNFYSDVVSDTDNILSITISDKDKNIAYGDFSYDKNGDLITLSINVNKDYRRIGLATLIYDEAEKYFGDKLMPSGSFESDEIEKFWINRNKKRG